MLNLKNLDQLIAEIRMQPTANVHMDWFLIDLSETDSGNRLSQENKLELAKEKLAAHEPCGTVACIAGYCCILIDKNELKYERNPEIAGYTPPIDYAGTGVKFLGINDDDIFSPKSLTEEELGLTDKEVALARLEYLKVHKGFVRYVYHRWLKERHHD